MRRASRTISRAAADFIVIDLGGSAATLRYIDTVPVAKDEDPYHALRKDHLDYVQKACQANPESRLADVAP